MLLLTLQSSHFSDMIAATFLHILQRIFALPALGFYYYHYLKLKDFFAKTLNDVRLDMGGKVYTKTVSFLLEHVTTEAIKTHCFVNWTKRYKIHCYL